MPVPRDSWPWQTRAEHADLRIGGWIQAGILAVGFAVAVLAVVAFAAPLQGAEQWAEVGTLLIYACAAYACGSAFGVLFGVPRSLPQQPASISPAPNTANTNLEQISDWLTKIIVGVGLVQARSIADGLAGVVDRLSGGLTTPDAAPFVGSLTAYAAVVGFLTGWLLARVWLARLLSASDRTLPNEPVPVTDPSQARGTRKSWVGTPTPT